MQETTLCPSCRAPGSEAGERCPRCGEAMRVGGCYLLTALRAESAAGEVYAARDTRGGIARVVTAPRGELELRARRFERVRAVEHLSLVPLVEQLRVPLAGGLRLFQVRAEVPGETLAERIARGEALDEDTARRVLAALLDALEHLHGSDPAIVHGGIHPGRVVLGAQGTVLLTGLEALPEDDLGARAGYVAFEQAAGHLLPGADVYALGMSVIAALAGVPATALPLAFLRVQYEHRVHCSAGLNAVLWRMTEAFIEQRYGHAGMARAALASVLGEAVPARRARATRTIAEGYDGEDVGVGRRVTVPEMTARRWHEDDRLVWPEAATASSTFGAGWSPSVVTGPPMVYPQHGDLQGAWASRSGIDGIQWLEVRFPAGAPPAMALWVFETFNPGALYAVTDASPGAGAAVLWKGEPAAGEATAQVLEVVFPSARAITALRLWLDTTVSVGWNEIDTVALVAERPLGRGTPDWRRPGERGASVVEAPGAGPSRGYDGVAVGAGRRIAASVMERTEWRARQDLVWPEGATASSTYGGGWSPSVVVGPPRVFPAYGDLQGAWAPRGMRDGVQWLEVRFPASAPPAAALWVFETLNPGAVFAVTDATPQGGGALLWQAEPCGMEAEAQVLEIDLAGDRVITAVRLWLDTTVGSSWNEVDTVALVPVVRQ